MITAVDTTALLALLYDDDRADASETALRRAHRQGRVVVTPTVYAELAADGCFRTTAGLEEFLQDLAIRVADPSRRARSRAGQRYREYAADRPTGECPSCGAARPLECTACGWRHGPRGVAAEFLIGGHAAVDGDALVSLDDAFYEAQFPALSVQPE